MVCQSWPVAVDAAAFDVAAHHEHAIRVTMIGSAVPIFFRGASELAHGYHYHVPHPVAHVLMKRSKPLTQVFEQVGELPLNATFIHVIVPATAIDEQNFHADVGLQQL